MNGSDGSTMSGSNGSTMKMEGEYTEVRNGKKNNMKS